MMTRNPSAAEPVAVVDPPAPPADVLRCHSCANRWMSQPDDELCEVCAEAARQGIPLFRWDGQPL